MSFFLGSESCFHSTDEDVQNLLGFNLLFYPPVLWQCNYISLASLKTCSFPRNLMQKKKSFTTFPYLCVVGCYQVGLCIPPVQGHLGSSRKWQSFTKSKVGRKSKTLLTGNMIHLHLSSGNSLENCCNLASSLWNNCSPRRGRKEKKEILWI